MLGQSTLPLLSSQTSVKCFILISSYGPSTASLCVQLLLSMTQFFFPCNATTQVLGTCHWGYAHSTRLTQLQQIDKLHHHIRPLVPSISHHHHQLFPKQIKIE